jgi:predicted dehydrogenase
MNPTIRLGFIGGGQGSFIGAVHRIASRIDGQYHIVCGALSSNPTTAKESGLALGFGESRIYESYEAMIAAESNLPANERMQVVAIVTPNHVHFHPAKLAMEAGFDVILDKPITFTLDEAMQLEQVQKATGRKLLLTHTYTGYPMVKQAKQLIADGKIGAIRKVYVEYPQGWLSTFLEADNQKQAAWRTDPTKSGKAGAMGDIGTHAFNLAEYVSGLQVSKLCADINIKVQGRLLDDDGAVLLKFNNGASGVLMATQIGAGEENNLKIRVFGELGSLQWQQEDNNTLLVRMLDKPAEIWRAGTGYLSPNVQHNIRVPAGHPEGYLEAFANLYRNFAAHVTKGDAAAEADKDYPSVHDGIRGMLFVDKVIESGQSEAKWIDL